MTRESDIRELLNEVSELLLNIKGIYQQALSNEEVTQLARPKVKSCFEHLRSCLDYIINDLVNYSTSPIKKGRKYFPYSKTQAEFEKKFKDTLGSSHPYYSLLESIQPHKCSDYWLYDLCKIVNYNKHDRLGTQQRQNSSEFVTQLGRFIKMDSTSKVIIHGGATINGVPITNGKKLEITGEKSVQEIKKSLNIPFEVQRNYESVQFLISHENRSIDVLELFSKAHHEIAYLVDQIYI